MDFRSNVPLFVALYATVLATHALINWAEFRRRPEKRERYRALPWRYKFACWFLVAPQFAGTMIQGALFVPALVSYMLLEAACVRWYRKAGLLVDASRCSVESAHHLRRQKNSPHGGLFWIDGGGTGVEPVYTALQAILISN